MVESLRVNPFLFCLIRFCMERMVASMDLECTWEVGVWAQVPAVCPQDHPPLHGPWVRHQGWMYQVAMMGMEEALGEIPVVALLKDQVVVMAVEEEPLVLAMCFPPLVIFPDFKSQPLSNLLECGIRALQNGSWPLYIGCVVMACLRFSGF